MRRILLPLALWLASIVSVGAQVTGPPFTFTNGTVADATEVNANFNSIFSNALNRTGGTMTGTLNSRSVIPTAANTYDLGSSALPFQSDYLRTSMVLVQSTANYTVTWANPASARALLIPDPGGSDSFAYLAATQTLSNKTIAAPVFSGTSSGTYTLGGTGTWAGVAIGPTVGGTNQTSWTTGDLLYASGSNTLAKRAIGTTGQVLSVVAGIPQWQGANITLLYQANGTATAGAAANVDTFALASGLTVKDTLLIVLEHENTGGAANILPILYNNSDAVTVATLSQANGTYYLDYVVIGAHTTTRVGAVTARFGTSAGERSTFVTSWTGNWTVALRHGGITGPDTWVWKWAIYKIAGQ